MDSLVTCISDASSGECRDRVQVKILLLLYALLLQKAGGWCK